MRVILEDDVEEFEEEEEGEVPGIAEVPVYGNWFPGRNPCIMP